METTMNRNTYDKIELAADTKGRMFLDVAEILRMLLERSKDEQRLDILEMVIAQKEFGEIAAKVVAGQSDHEWDSWGTGSRSSEKSVDTLRTALLPYAEAAAVQLVSRVLEENQKLRNIISDKETHIKKLLEQWPDSYKKYVPKEDWTYASRTYIDDGKAVKLIEHVRENGMDSL